MAVRTFNISPQALAEGLAIIDNAMAADGDRFDHESVAAAFQDVATRHGLPPHSLMLEVAEQQQTRARRSIEIMRYV